jgi:hypothetical protein
MRKTLAVLFISVTISCVTVSAAVSEELIKAEAVYGNTYKCFFYSPVEVFSSELIFGDSVSMSLPRFSSGAGYCVALGNSFAGVYNAVDESLDGKNVDIVITLLGVTRQPFIFGVGTIVLNYSETYPLVFQGMLQDEDVL